MQIIIEIHYYSVSPSLRRGEFRVNAWAYRKDPDREAARIALDWFTKVRRETLSEVRLEKIIYNDNHDITDLVKQLEWEHRRKIESEYNDLPF